MYISSFFKVLMLKFQDEYIESQSQKKKKKAIKKENKEKRLVQLILIEICYCKSFVKKIVVI